MTQPSQLPLFTLENADVNEDIKSSVLVTSHLQDLGTFKDNMKAPIHGWFKYPAGYSYKFVYRVFEEMSLREGQWVFDPFSGTGTTLICAKSRGINGFGIEAHAFVHWVAQVKLFWEFDYTLLLHQVTDSLKKARLFVSRDIGDANLEGAFPELVYKCYHPKTLQDLYLLREFIQQVDVAMPLRQLMKLALTDTLRTAAAAGTGWPYIAPNKNTGHKPPKNALKIFEDTLKKMCQDLYDAGRDLVPGQIHNILGDSRLPQAIPDSQIDLALTSPPYLNNYDYADRTRLETYFWGIAHTWRDITEMYRDKLMVAATTQIVRSQYTVEKTLSQEINQLDSGIYETLQNLILHLSQKRLTKGGKKDYDLMVALYFNDILSVLQQTYRVLKSGGRFYLVLGDSAPYGVHIPTETFIGQMGLALGFRKREYIEFRKRGRKWKNNPQRHNVPLHEGVLILTK